MTDRDGEDLKVAVRPVRSRGAVARTAPPRGGEQAPVRLNGPEALTAMLDRELPDDPWVVVIEGREGAFAARVVGALQAARPDIKLWGIDENASTDGELAARRLRLSSPNDAAIQRSLVADLVIVSSEPKSGLAARLARWKGHAARVLVEDASAVEVTGEPGARWLALA